MEQILVIAKLDNVVKNIYNEVSKKYVTQLVSFNWENIDNSLKLTPIDLIFIVIKDLSQSESVALHRIMQHPQYGQIPMILLGSQVECREHFGKWGGRIERIIFSPITLSQLLKEVDSIIAKISGNEISENSNSESATEVGQSTVDPLKTILVVDDDIVMLRTIMNWLKDEYHVSVAKSGAAALTYLGKQKPDLILLDYEMPVTSGYQTLQMIRAEDTTKDIPVFFLTAVSDPERVKAAMSLKPEGYILKTCGQQTLLERMKSFFEKK